MSKGKHSKSNENNIKIIKNVKEKLQKDNKDIEDKEIQRKNKKQKKLEKIEQKNKMRIEEHRKIEKTKIEEKTKNKKELKKIKNKQLDYKDVNKDKQKQKIINRDKEIKKIEDEVINQNNYKNENKNGNRKNIKIQKNLKTKKNQKEKIKKNQKEKIKKNIKINKKKVIISSIILIVIIFFTIVYLVYCNNIEFRNFVDMEILFKEISQNDAISLEVQNLSESNIIAFNDKIGVLNKNVLEIYSTNASKVAELNIEISNSLYSSESRFLVIGEDEGSKVYLIENNAIKWENTVEGNISKVYVNKNGYVAVLITGTSYQTIIQMYDLDGTELFKSYLASTTAIDLSISNDNKYLAFAEIDTTRKCY